MRIFMFIYILLIVIAIILIYVLITYNSFKTLSNKVDEAFSTMDVYLKKRFDLIPNLVSVTKAYARHEAETLENIVKARSYDSIPDSEKLKTNEEISNTMSNLLALSESYPELKASENFKNLSENLVKIEDDIANARKYYNAVIKLYNNKVEQFPSNLCAKLFGYKIKTMFIASEEDRKSVSVILNEKKN